MARSISGWVSVWLGYYVVGVAVWLDDWLGDCMVELLCGMVTIW